MRQTDPLQGYRQLIKGYFPVQRYVLLKLLLEQKLSVTDLGYFILFIAATDYSPKPHRHGLLRLELTELSKVFKIGYSTLYSQFTKLKAIGLIVNDETRKSPRLANYENFTSKVAIANAKTELTNQQIASFFQIDGNFKPESGTSFNSSYKSDFNDYSSGSSKKEEEMIGGLSKEDIDWISENVKNRSP